MKIISSLFRILYRPLLVIALGVCAWECESDYDLELPLAVNDNIMNLKKTKGSTHVLVYATDGWSASFDTETPWATIENPKGSGNGEFILHYEANAGIARKTVVKIISGERLQTIEIKQPGEIEEIDLELLEETVSHIAWGDELSIPLRTNLGNMLDGIGVWVEYLNPEQTTDTEGWISQVELGEETLTCAITENTTGAARKARLTLSIEDPINERTYQTSTLIEQTTESGNMAFTDETLEIGSFGKTYRAEWTTNIATYMDQIETEVTCESAGDSWIGNVIPGADGVLFDATENTLDKPRNATIRLTLVHGSETLQTSLKVTQTRPEKVYTLAGLRALLPSAGRLDLTADCVEGVIIGDAGNANMGLNPFLAWDMIDFTVNDRTNYLQSPDGGCGICLRMKEGTPGDALKRYSTVKIALSGLTLVREDNPVRYALEGLDCTTGIIESTAGTSSALVEKRKAITELTDDDIYTFVTLKDVEIAIDFGSYGNYWEPMGLKTTLTPEGMSETNARCDCVPRLLRDKENNTLNMLINSQTPWRCIGKDVPHGAGDVSGVIVHSELSQYGDIGTYQIRPLVREEIALSEDNDSGFSQKLATWYYPQGTTQYPGGASIQNLLSRPDFSLDDKAYMNNSVKAKWGQTPLLFSSSFGNIDEKAIRASSPATGWWNATKGTGEYVYWGFSTANVSAGKHLTLVFMAALGNTIANADTNFNPLYWDVLYSVDGTDFTKIKQVAIYPAPDRTRTYRADKLPAGRKEVIVELPDCLAGQSNVTIRLQAASNQAIDPQTGEVTATAKAVSGAYMHFGAVIVKYNK